MKTYRYVYRLSVHRLLDDRYIIESRDRSLIFRSSDRLTAVKDLQHIIPKVRAKYRSRTGRGCDVHSRRLEAGKISNGRFKVSAIVWDIRNVS